jgi:hypothetical protein
MTRGCAGGSTLVYCVSAYSTGMATTEQVALLMQQWLVEPDRNLPHSELSRCR